MGSVAFLAWIDGCCMAPGKLSVSGSRTVNGVSRDLVKYVYYRFNRPQTVIQVNPSPGSDMRIYRTVGEAPCD